MIDAIIIFVDIINSTRYAEALLRHDYHEILAQLGTIGKNIRRRFEFLGTHVDIRGEELLIIIPVKADAREPARAAIEIAYQIKIRWTFSAPNRIRIEENATPLNIAIGIHFGRITRLSTRGQGPRYLGTSFNFAKRVEDSARQFRSTGIAVSQSFIGICRARGVPIETGPELTNDLQGFASPEPIFGLRSQYCMTLADLKLEQKLMRHFSSHDDLVSSHWFAMFKRDPIRSLWLIEMTIDYMFFNDKPQDVIQHIAPILLIHNQSPSVLYRIARCYHRAVWPSLDLPSMTQREAVAHSIDLYRAAGKHFIWGKLDQVASHWKHVLQYPAAIEYRQSDGRALLQVAKEDAYVQSLECKTAISLCDDVVGSEPLHFSAYNLRALCMSEYLQRISALTPPSSRGYVYWGDAKSLAARAEDDLRLARSRNPGPEYLYLGTEAALILAKMVAGLSDDAKAYRLLAVRGLKKIEQAEKSVRTKLDSLNSEQLPFEDYWQDGFAVPSAPPPRKSQLLARWDKLKVILKEYAQ